MIPRNKTILLVDDDQDFLFQTELALKKSGFNVITAAGQEQAEKKLQEMKPDIAVLDLMMEHMDGGFALAYHIKKMDSSIPVIIVTAVANETGLEFDASTNEEKSWIKADAFLAKPLRYEQLEKAINRLIS